MTSDTLAPLRTSPTGRVPLWLVLEDALADVDPTAWARPEPAVAAPAPVVHRATARPAPTSRAGRVGTWVLDRTIIAVASSVLAVLGAFGLGD